jgi:hypothetical protein
MAYFYHDTDAGVGTSPYDTWAKASGDIELVIAAMSAGDICFSQGAADDTKAGVRSMACPGTITNPNTFIACKDGTTNEGASITTSDLVGSGTRPRITTTTSSGSLRWTTGASFWYGYEFQIFDRVEFWAAAATLMDTCNFIQDNDYIQLYVNSRVTWRNVDIQCIGQWSYLRLGAIFNWIGGSYIHTGTTRDRAFDCNGTEISVITGVDLTEAITGTTALFEDFSTAVRLVSCKMPSSYTMSLSYTAGYQPIEVIGSSDAGSVANTASVQDYTKECIEGTVDLQTTNVRTGAADDGASGVFCYDMTPRVNATLESSSSTVKSPWLSTWVAGGAEITCNVYVANDSGADFNEDDMWCEWITPDESDTTQHEHSFVPGDERLILNTTPVTDDDSSWVTVANPQKFVKTFTPGYVGWVQARVHFAKRYAATPATLTVDPKIEAI